MATARQFNETLFQLLTDMKTCLPSNRELKMAVGLYGAMLQTSPGNAIAANMFWKFASEHKEAILNKDWDTIRKALSTLCPQPGVIDQLWEGLSEDNRTIVGDYVLQLYSEAEAYVSKAGKAPPSPDDGPPQVVCEVYNKMWLDFLQELVNEGPDGSPSSKPLQDAIVKMQKFVQRTSSRRHDGLYRLFFPLLKDVMPDQTDEMAILSLIQPPKDGPASIEKDVYNLSNVPFPFYKDWSIGQVISSATSDRLCVYWHYIKVMTCVMAHCPPEILTMMSEFVQV